jgi:chemotaxis protein methyltransferase CheR
VSREPKALSARTLAQFEQFFRDRLGLIFSPSNKIDLERGIKDRLGANPSLGTPADYLLHLKGPDGKDELDHLIPLLTVGETYFFRNTSNFQALEHVILPRLISERKESRTLRIWSAGCSTGEEPYSIAILLDRILPDRESWDITILATDLNRVSLEQARRGIYRAWSFRDVPADQTEGYFTREGGLFHLVPRIKAMVLFSPLNLVEETYPSFVTQTTSQDLILCRNVMIYFSADINRVIIERFHRSLRPGGYLIIGHAEHNLEHFERFRSINLGDNIIYQKPRKTGPSPLTDTARIPFRGERPMPPSPKAIEEIHLPTEPRNESAPEGRIFQAAVELYKVGETDAAMELFDKVASMNPTNARAMYMVAEIQANRGQIGDCDRWLRRCLDADPLFPEAWYLRGLIQREKGDEAGAALAFKRAVFLKKDFGLVHFQLADLSLKEGNLPQALLFLSNAEKSIDGMEDRTPFPGSDDLSVGKFREMIGVMRNLVLKKGIGP